MRDDDSIVISEKMRAAQEDTPQPTCNRHAQNSVIAAYCTYLRRVYCNIVVVGRLCFMTHRMAARVVAGALYL